MRKFLILSVMVLIVMTASAIPAKRGIWRMLKLTDGTEVKAQLVGDEHAHFWLADDGTRYRKTADGTYAAVSKETITKKAIASRKRHAIGRRTLRQGAQRKASSQFIGDKKGLIILVNFSDKKFGIGHDRDFYDKVANEEGYTDSNGFEGSVSDYFKDQSFGVFRLDFDVVGPVQLANGYAYYGEDDENGDDMRAGEMVVEACRAVDDEVDFSVYDWDGDGFVDQVYVLYAWHGTATYSDDDTVWQHEYTLEESDYGKTLTLDDVQINTYACSSELGQSRIDGIGTICHEFSHCLGFPDMYDTQYEGNFGMGSWDLMCSGSYNGGSFCPAGYTSYERWVAGWLDPIELTEDMSVTDMKALSDGGESYVIYNDAHPDEYYLLENRQLTGWDRELPAAGMLILHVDYDETVWQWNIVNDIVDYSDYEGYEDCVNDHQRLTIFHADDDDDSSYWNSHYQFYSKTTEEGDPYPYGSNNMLTNSSKPSATLYNKNTDGKKLMNKSVTDITQNEDGTLAFNFSPEPASVVPEGGLAFYESFNLCDGTGGNDGLWNSTIASAVFNPDNEGWESEKAYGANQCAKFGTSSIVGVATTPEFYVDGEATFTFLAGAWNTGKEKTDLSLIASDGATLSKAAFTMKKGEWTDFTTVITANGNVQIQFVGSGRFFLDEVKAIVPQTGIAETIIKTNRNLGVVYDLQGRRVGSTMNFSSLPKGIYIVDGKKVVR